MSEVNTASEIQPNMTIYINNLNEKIKLDGIYYFYFFNSPSAQLRSLFVLNFTLFYVFN